MPKSPYPDVKIPAGSIYQYLFGDLTDAEREKIAIIDGSSGAETTFGQLVAQIDGLAGALQKRGVERGDVIALLSPNVPIFATAFHGILRAGAVVTTVNVLYTAEDIAYQLTNSGAKWVFTVSPFLAHVQEAADAVGIPRDKIVVLDGAEGYTSLRDLLTDSGPVTEYDIDSATEIAVLPYSSGTTGYPKGVQLSHRNLIANVEQCLELIGVGADDRILGQLPFFHIYGMTVLLNLASKSRVPIITVAKFEVDSYLKTIQDHKASYVFIAPPIAVMFAKHPAVDQYDLSSITSILSGAAPLDGELSRAVADRLGVEMLQGYGMTEMSPVSHLIPRGTDISRETTGVAVPNTEFLIVDTQTGAELEATETGPSEPGELWVRGPQVMVGYLANEQATADTLDADGYLHTGDIAVVYPDGSVTVVDRLKELIKYKGYQIPPAELEALLLTNSDIADAAVIGVLDDERQEIPKAFVVRKPSATLTEDDVMSFVAERVAPHKKVRRVEFVDVIPKSGSGKVLRKDLRVREAERAATESQSVG